MWQTKLQSKFAQLEVAELLQIAQAYLLGSLEGSEELEGILRWKPNRKLFDMACLLVLNKCEAQGVTLEELDVDYWYYGKVMG